MTAGNPPNVPKLILYLSCGRSLNHNIFPHYKLDESTARRQLKSVHYLVDPYTWPWSPNGHGHGHEWPTDTPFVQCQSALPFWDTAISKFDHANPWSSSCVWSKVKVTFDFQNSKVKVMFKVKPIGHIWGLEFNWYVCFFVSWQSDHVWLRYRKFHIWPWKFKVKVMAKVKPDGHIWGLGVQAKYLLLVSCQSDHFWLRYRKFHIWPWKFKFKVMAKVKPDGHIWGIGFKWICLLFISWQSDHFWLTYSKFNIRLWKFKVKVMAKVEPDGQIGALEFNRYVYFIYVAIGPFLAEI